MPELPEVETIVRTLKPQILGRRIDSITVLHPKVLQDESHILEKIQGGTITKVSRRAKLLLLDVSPISGMNGSVIMAFHLKMTGRFFVHPQGTPPLKHTRLIFDLGEEGRLFFDDMRTFGYCRIMVPEQLPEWSFWSELGPEPLEGTASNLAAHLQSAFTGKRSAVKAALLDQRVLAGIGNIYADESLFQAGIRPDAKASELSRERLYSLAESLQTILQRSIDECGSSIRDYRDANGNAGAFQNSFLVYGRKGQNCCTCGCLLEATRIAGRGTVFCPQCQT